MVKEERTGKRDYHWSVDHRTFPDNYYHSDADAMEFDSNGDLKILTEIKHPNVSSDDLKLDGFLMRAKRKVALKSAATFLVIIGCYYDEAGWILGEETPRDVPISSAQYYVIDATDPKTQTYTLMSRREFVAYLGNLRNADVTQQTLDHYSDWKLPEEWIEVKIKAAL